MSIVLLLIGGLMLLILGGELLVRGASKLAISIGISPLAVGLTVVAFGTSAPEMAVSFQAAFSGQVDLALGNVVGSNIFNVLFILGLTALITPLVVNGQMIRQEVPIMIGASLLLLAVALDGSISRGEGAIFFALLVLYTVFLIWQSRRQTRALRDEYAGEIHMASAVAKKPSWSDRFVMQIVLIVAGLVLLVLGSRWLVEGATGIARSLGVSELIIGLTVVAGGTSLPEVAASVTAAIRGQRDIAVGNVVGSSIFNIFCVLGLSALLAPTPLPVAPSLLKFDLLVMVAVAIACLPIFITGHRIARWEGGVFLAYYIAYTVYLILASSQHDTLGTYALVLQVVVLPLTILTLLLGVTRSWKARHRAS